MSDNPKPISEIQSLEDIQSLYRKHSQSSSAVPSVSTSKTDLTAIMARRPGIGGKPDDNLELEYDSFTVLETYLNKQYNSHLFSCPAIKALLKKIEKSYKSHLPPDDDDDDMFDDDNALTDEEKNTARQILLLKERLEQLKTLVANNIISPSASGLADPTQEQMHQFMTEYNRMLQNAKGLLKGNAKAAARGAALSIDGLSDWDGEVLLQYCQKNYTTPSLDAAPLSPSHEVHSAEKDDDGPSHTVVSTGDGDAELPVSAAPVISIPDAVLQKFYTDFQGNFKITRSEQAATTSAYGKQEASVYSGLDKDQILTLAKEKFETAQSVSTAAEMEVHDEVAEPAAAEHPVIGTINKLIDDLTANKQHLDSDRVKPDDGLEGLRRYLSSVENGTTAPDDQALIKYIEYYQREIDGLAIPVDQLSDEQQTAITAVSNLITKLKADNAKYQSMVGIDADNTVATVIANLESYQSQLASSPDYSGTVAAWQEYFNHYQSQANTIDAQSVSAAAKVGVSDDDGLHSPSSSVGDGNSSLSLIAIKEERSQLMDEISTLINKIEDDDTGNDELNESLVELKRGLLELESPILDTNISAWSNYLAGWRNYLATCQGLVDSIDAESAHAAAEVDGHDDSPHPYTPPSSALPSSALPSSALPSSALPSSALPYSALPPIPVSLERNQLSRDISSLIDKINGDDTGKYQELDTNLVHLNRAISELGNKDPFFTPDIEGWRQYLEECQSQIEAIDLAIVSPPLPYRPQYYNRISYMTVDESDLTAPENPKNAKAQKYVDGLRDTDKKAYDDFIQFILTVDEQNCFKKTHCRHNSPPYKYGSYKKRTGEEVGFQIDISKHMKEVRDSLAGNFPLNYDQIKKALYTTICNNINQRFKEIDFEDSKTTQKNVADTFKELSTILNGLTACAQNGQGFFDLQQVINSMVQEGTHQDIENIIDLLNNSLKDAMTGPKADRYQPTREHMEALAQLKVVAMGLPAGHKLCRKVQRLEHRIKKRSQFEMRDDLTIKVNPDQFQGAAAANAIYYNPTASTHRKANAIQNLITQHHRGKELLKGSNFIPIVHNNKDNPDFIERFFELATQSSPPRHFSALLNNDYFKLWFLDQQKVKEYLNNHQDIKKAFNSTYPISPESSQFYKVIITITRGVEGLNSLEKVEGLSRLYLSPPRDSAVPSSSVIFKGYESTNKQVSGGEQAKSEGTGIYRKNGVQSFIKRSVSGDDIAEANVSQTVRDFLPPGQENLFARCTLLQSENPDGHHRPQVWLASEMANGFEDLYSHAGAKNFLKDKFRTEVRVGGRAFTFGGGKASLKKKLISDSLNEQQTQSLAYGLAGCLWLRNYDVQSQNFGVTQNGKGPVVAIDFGWGEAGICRPGEQRVKPFVHRTNPLRSDEVKKRKSFGIGFDKTLNPFEAFYSSSKRASPSNHFNDYPGVMYSSAFTKALEPFSWKPTVIPEISFAQKVEESTEARLDEIRQAYTPKTVEFGKPDSEAIAFDFTVTRSNGEEVSRRSKKLTKEDILEIHRLHRLEVKALAEHEREADISAITYKRPSQLPFKKVTDKITGETREIIDLDKLYKETDLFLTDAHGNVDFDQLFDEGDDGTLTAKGELPDEIRLAIEDIEKRYSERAIRSDGLTASIDTLRELVYLSTGQGDSKVIENLITALRALEKEIEKNEKLLEKVQETGLKYDGSYPWNNQDEYTKFLSQLEKQRAQKYEDENHIKRLLIGSIRSSDAHTNRERVDLPLGEIAALYAYAKHMGITEKDMTLYAQEHLPPEHSGKKNPVAEVIFNADTLRACIAEKRNSRLVERAQSNALLGVTLDTQRAMWEIKHGGKHHVIPEGRTLQLQHIERLREFRQEKKYISLHDHELVALDHELVALDHGKITPEELEQYPNLKGLISEYNKVAAQQTQANLKEWVETGYSAVSKSEKLSRYDRGILYLEQIKRYDELLKSGEFPLDQLTDLMPRDNGHPVGLGHLKGAGNGIVVLRNLIEKASKSIEQAMEQGLEPTEEDMQHLASLRASLEKAKFCQSWRPWRRNTVLDNLDNLQSKIIKKHPHLYFHATDIPDPSQSLTAHGAIQNDQPLPQGVVKSLPPRGQTELYFSGTNLGDRVVIGDKPGGVEMGETYYIRDTVYFDYLTEVVSGPGLDLDRDYLFSEVRRARVTYSEKDFIDNYRQQINKAYNDYYIKCQYEKPVVEPISRGQFTTNMAKRTFNFVKSFPTPPPPIPPKTIEEEMSANPVLARIIFKDFNKHHAKRAEEEREILHQRADKMNNKEPVSFRGGNAGLRRMGNTNTAKKKGAKAYQQSLLKSLDLILLNDSSPDDSSDSRANAAKLKLQLEQARSLPKGDIPWWKGLSVSDEDKLKNSELASTRQQAIATATKNIEEYFEEHDPDALIRADKARRSFKDSWKANLWISAYHFGKKESTGTTSLDAEREVAAIRQAALTGVPTQTTWVEKGQYIDPSSPKHMVGFEWQDGLKTFADLSKKDFTGSDGLTYKNIRFTGSNPPGKLAHSSFLAGEVSSNGQKELRSMSHQFPLGQHLAFMLFQNDRDKVGKKGQNLGFLKKPNGEHQLFIFDIGKSFKASAKVMEGLSDDFSFKQPSNTNDQKNLVNHDMFYDCPLSERMEGMHKLMKMFGVTHQAIGSPEGWDSIYAYEPPKQGCLLEPFEDAIIDTLAKACDIAGKTPIPEGWDKYDKNESNYADKVQELIDELENRKANTSWYSSDRKKLNKQIKELKYYQKSIAQQQELRSQSIENAEKMIEVFKDRVALSPEELNALDNLEKLISEGTTHLSDDGQVILNG